MTTTTYTTTETTTINSVTNTSATTATRTTATSTGTSTTTTYVVACPAGQMYCTAPNVNYTILGSETNALCQAQSAGNYAFFNITLAECNSSRSFDLARAVVVDTITLVPKASPFGLQVWGEQPPVENTIACICESPVTGTATAHGTGTEVVLAPPKETGKNIIGTGEFKPTLHIYTNNSFEKPLEDGAAFPAKPRLYMKVTAVDTSDLIGLINCTAAPTKASSDPYTVEFLQASCPTGPLDHTVHAQSANEVEFSTKTFKFGGHPDVFISCSVLRCDSAPCGECDTTRRRLLDQQPRSLAVEPLAHIVVWLRTAPAVNVAVSLPGPLERDSFQPVWSPVDGNSTNDESSLQPHDRVLSGTIDLFDYRGSLGTSFMAALTEALAISLAIQPHQVKLKFIWGSSEYPKIFIVGYKVVTMNAAEFETAFTKASSMPGASSSFTRLLQAQFATHGLVHTFIGVSFSPVSIEPQGGSVDTEDFEVVFPWFALGIGTAALSAVPLWFFLRRCRRKPSK